MINTEIEETEMNNTNKTNTRQATRECAPTGQLLRSTVYALLAGVGLLFTGSAAFAQGDNSNLLTGWSCDSDGDGTVDDDDYVRIEISGGGTVIGETTRRVEEGDDVVIEVVRTVPVSLAHCDVNPATPWVMALRLTRVATTGASERVPDSLLYERRVEIHRDQQRFTLRIPTLDNRNTGKDTKIDITLVATSETDSRIILDDAHIRVEIWDVDVHNYYFDVVCDTDSIIGSVSVIEEAGAKVEVNLKVDYPPEYDISVLVVTLDGSANEDTDYVRNTESAMFEDGNDTAKLSVQILNDGLLEDTEIFSIRSFRNGLVGHARVRGCTNEDGDVVETSGASLTVTIIDDDTAIMDLGPEVRNAWAGYPIPISGRWDTESTECVVPFSLFMNATASGALENGTCQRL